MCRYLYLAKKLYKKGNFKQSRSTLVSELLQETYDAHNAVADVAAVQKLYVTKFKPSVSMLQELLFHICTHVFICSFKDLRKISSQGLASNMCKSGLSLEHLKLAFQRGGDEGVWLLVKEKVDGHAKVTSGAKQLDAIVNFLNC